MTYTAGTLQNQRLFGKGLKQASHCISFISDPYGWGMYIPLKTTLYKFDNSACKDIYDTINSDRSTLQLKIDESVMCAGIPQERQSEIQRLDGGVNDACSVSLMHFDFTTNSPKFSQPSEGRRFQT